MPNIETIAYENAEGQLKEIYDQLLESRGKIAEVHKIQSLNPKTIVQHMELYMGIMFGHSPLKRYQREMMAVVVSKANDCNYCQLHHIEALNFYWKNTERCNALKQDYRSAQLKNSDLALCEMSWQLTKYPGKNQNGEQVAHLKQLGFNDRSILDATLVIAYFNFVNRIVLNLEVTPSKAEVGGYNY
ncbi:MAG: peroxidase-related enzyme [Bacteroidia bacterium]